MRPRLSYANVVSTLALVLAVGTGGAWAATQISGSLIKKNTITGNKLKKATITHREINEAKLKEVPSAASATNAANALNSALLGGTGPEGFVKGGGTQTTGLTTGPAGDNPNVIKTFTTAQGEFRLACGNASADVRYFNTTPGDAHVFRTVVGGTTNAFYNLEASGGTGLGFAATSGQGPHFVEIRAGKGEQVAVLRTGMRREPTGACIFDWELVNPG